MEAVFLSQVVIELPTDNRVVWGKSLHIMAKDNAKSFLSKCRQIWDEIEQAGLLSETLGCLPLSIEGAGLLEIGELYKLNKTKALKEGLSAANKRPYYRKTESRYGKSH